MFNLQSILGKKFKKSSVGTSITAALVCEQCEMMFGELFGPELTESISVISFKKYTITIRTASSVISQEIKLRESEIVSAINLKLGDPVVRQLRFLG